MMAIIGESIEVPTTEMMTRKTGSSRVGRGQWWASLTLKFRVNSKLNTVNFQLLTQSPVKLNKYASLFAKMVIDSKKYRFFFSSLILNKHCKKRSNQSEQNNLGIDGTSF